MASFLDLNCDLLTIPFSTETDFTVLADCCVRFAETLIDCHEPTQKMALSGRPGACLSLLRPTLGEPVPQHLIGYFTVVNLLDAPQNFEPDAEVLCDYCQSLKVLNTTIKRTIGILFPEQHAKSFQMQPEYRHHE